MFIFFISGCKKEETKNQWHIKIEDGTEVYNYSGVSFNPIAADDMSASFKSYASFGSSGSTIIYNTASEFVIKFGNISRLSFSIIFSTFDSAITAGLKSSNSNTVRFNAFKQVVKTGSYKFNGTIAPFNIYQDKKGTLWSTDNNQSNFLEVVSVTPNTQDNTANALITQINFDIALKDINNTSTKRIKGSTFCFFNLN